MDISKYVKLTICFKKIIILSSCFNTLNIYFHNLL